MAQGSSNPTTNLKRINGTTVDTNTGNASAGTQRVVLASNQPVIPVSDNGGSLTVDGSVTVTQSTASNLNATVTGTVAATQSGTWNINNISGTISLPTGAATETTLSNIKTAVELLDNTVLAASTAPNATNPSLNVSLGPNSKAYDPQDDMLKIKSMQKKFRDSFTGSAIDSTKWDTSVGDGGSITVSGGTVILASGTTASSVTSILSKETFTIPFRLSFHLTLSQRIANQTFIVEAVSVNPSTGVPDGINSIAWLFDGTTATQAKYRVQNGGITPLDSAASTVVTTAGSGVYEIEPFADEAWFHSLTIDSTAGRSNSYRRHQQIPDPNALYKIRLRWVNGSTPPASSTNATLQYVACQDYTELTAEITAGRGNTVAGTSLGVLITNTPTVITYARPVVSGTTYQPSNATTTGYANSLVVKTSAGALFCITGYNSRTSPQFIHVYNATSLPADGAKPVLIFRVPAESNFSLDLTPYGRYFTTGIVVGNSTTGPTKTIGAADCWFDVQYL